MTTTEVICVSILAISYIVVGIVGISQYKLIKKYDNYFKHSNEYTDMIADYCLTDIMRKAVEREDYAEAAKVRDIITKMKSLKK